MLTMPDNAFENSGRGFVGTHKKEFALGLDGLPYSVAAVVPSPSPKPTKPLLPGDAP